MPGRYISHHQPPLLQPSDTTSELVSSLTTLITSYPPLLHYPHHSLHGLFSGPTSVAYLFLQLSVSHSDLRISSHDLKHWCRAYLSGSRSSSHVTPDRCGIGNETLAFDAVYAALTQDQQHISKLETWALRIAEEQGGCNEWLYGRAGFLYLLRLVQHWIPSSTERISVCVKRLSERILNSGPPWP